MAQLRNCPRVTVFSYLGRNLAPVPDKEEDEFKVVRSISGKTPEPP